MHKFYTFLLAGLLYSLSALAQHEYRPGFIVNLQGDTINYEIEFKDHPSQFNFCKAKVDGSVQEFTADHILAYGIYDAKRVYQAGIVDDKFVKVLVIGALNLYKTDDGFLVEKEGKQFSLENTFKDISDARNTNQRSQKWKGTFAYLISDCSATSKSDSQIKFNENSLTRLAAKYNDCRGVDYEKYLSDKKTSFVVGVVGSQVFTNLKTIDDLGRYTWLSNNYKFNGPSYGMQLTMSSANKYSRMALCLGIRYYSGSVEEFVYNDNGSSFNSHDVSISFEALTFPFSMRYAMPVKIVEPYIQLGFHVNHLMSSSTYRESINTVSSGTENSEGTAFIFRKVVFGPLAEAGLHKSLGNFDLTLSGRLSSTSAFVKESSVIRESSIYRTEFSLMVGRRIN